MSTRTSTVTVIIVHACVFAVRRACVPFSVDRSQSQKPVNAANTETIAPPIMTYVPARKKSRAQVSWRPSAAMMSRIAAKTYATTGKSVSGGCVGFPDQPRKPLNLRPFRVSVGRTENVRIHVVLPPRMLWETRPSGSTVTVRANDAGHTDPDRWGDDPQPPLPRAGARRRG